MERWQMRICLFSFISIFALLTSCDPKPMPPHYDTFFSDYYEKFNDSIYARTDSNDCSKFFSIIDTAYGNGNRRWPDADLFVKDDDFNKIDSVKIYEHLKNILELDCSRSAKKLNYGPFTVNMLIENSLSMNGYVNGSTRFRNSIYGLLLDMKSDSAFNKINAKYINKIVDSIETFTIEDGDARERISHFVERYLSVSGFAMACKKPKANCGETKIEAVIDSALKIQNDSTISVLVSDFIFSPKNKDNIKVSLESQQISITDAFKEKKNMHIAIYRLTSEFKGNYYDLNDRYRYGQMERPYFIWFLGSEPQLKRISEATKSSSLNGAEKVYLSYEMENSGFDAEEFSTNNDSIDLFFKANPPANKKDTAIVYPLQSKTFGFKYLLEGVKNAYEGQKR
jgi:hypothetical protein